MEQRDVDAGTLSLETCKEVVRVGRRQVCGTPER